MSQYTTYPKIWVPDDNSILLMVKAPSETTQLSRQTYRTLLAQRIEWMIQHWMEQTGETQAQTHQRLTQALTLLLSYQEAPRLMETDTDEPVPLWEWIDEWTETFMERNEVLMQKLAADFPVPLISIDLDELQSQTAQHDSILLDDWLTELTQGLTTESIL